MDAPNLLRHRSAALVAAAGLPVVWCSLAAQFRGSVTAATDALVLVVIVVAVAATGDRTAGIVAALSGAAWFDFFLTAPYNRFTIDDANDVEVAVLLLLVGVAVTEVGLWGRRQQAAASRRSGYLDGVMSTSKVVAGEFSSTALSDQVAAHITDLLEVDSCRFVQGTSWPGNSPVLGADGEVRVNAATVNVDRDGLPTLEETVLPAQSHGITYGHFDITASTEIRCPGLEQRRVAVLLANQVGAAYRSPSPGTHSR